MEFEVWSWDELRYQSLFWHEGCGIGISRFGYSVKKVLDSSEV